MVQNDFTWYGLINLREGLEKEGFLNLSMQRFKKLRYFTAAISQISQTTEIHFEPNSLKSVR